MMIQERGLPIGFGLRRFIGLVKVVEDNDNRAMYFLRDGPNRSFVSEELMIVPENTENPPDYVKKW